ncbi:cyclodeaminase/cyclohydrolase family protein [Clostridium aciditolerans]|nr:cyclodeaminase/cyclohydrolase family protein [Clostridium aciditolerans]
MIKVGINNMCNFHILNQIIDSKDFTTGGGSASAMAGAMASGLVAMVARLSINKAYGLLEDEYDAIIKEADKIAKELELGAQLDAEAYMLIKAAYILPKDTESDKKRRSQAIEKAGIEAAKVPMENAIKCKKIYEFCIMLKEKSNPNAISDLMAAEGLSKAGIEGCVLNIEANLPLIKDESIIARFKKEAVELRQV